MTTLYLEDLSVGQRFASGEVAVTAEAVKAFAAQFDPQPFHLDEAAARDSLFGGLAASGWHTAALTMRLVVEATPFAGGVVGSGGPLAWPRPTRPGDILHIEATVASITPSRSKPDRGMVVMDIETKNQRGEVVQTFSPKVVVWRRPAAP